jgi:hypothetical protein
MMKMAFIFPEKCLTCFLDLLLDNLQDLDFNTVTDLSIKILSNELGSVKSISSP